VRPQPREWYRHRRPRGDRDAQVCGAVVQDAAQHGLDQPVLRDRVIVVQHQRDRARDRLDLPQHSLRQIVGGVLAARSPGRDRLRVDLCRRQQMLADVVGSRSRSSSVYHSTWPADLAHSWVKVLLP
jgi:hypothetical protein